MKVGIGLPNAVPGTSGGEMTEFARRAEAQGFSSLGTIDRINYANWTPLIALAAAAAATKTIELMTTVMLRPASPQRRPNGEAGAQRQPALRRPADPRDRPRRSRRRL
jgi:hypothetical protein